jgi:hypothetical protein
MRALLVGVKQFRLTSSIIIVGIKEIRYESSEGIDDHWSTEFYSNRCEKVLNSSWV